MNNQKKIDDWDATEELEEDIPQRSENKQQMNNLKESDQPQTEIEKETESKSHHLSLSKALADRKVSILNDCIDIQALSDIYLVMDLPNLTKSKFAIKNDEFCNTLSCLDGRYVDLLDDNDNVIYDIDNQYLLGTSVFWNSIVLPALTYYCYGRYMRKSELLYHNRRLNSTDFTFSTYYPGENITISLANYRLAIVIDYDHSNMFNIKSIIYKVKLNNDPISATRTYKNGHNKNAIYEEKEGKSVYDLEKDGRSVFPVYRDKDLSLDTMVKSLTRLFY